MVETIISFSGCASALAILASALQLLGVCLQIPGLKDKTTAAFFSRQISKCRWFSILFLVGGWLICSCMTWEECLSGYTLLGNYCSLIGELWLAAGLIFFAASLLICCAVRTKEQISQMNSSASSATYTGILFWIVGLLLAGA